MSFIKRAMLSITRKKGKSILLLAIILILGNVIAGAISMKQAAANVEKKIKAEMGTAATLEVDWPQYEKRMQEAEGEPVEIKNISADLINQVGSSSYVKYYDYTTNAGVGSETLQKWLPEDQPERAGGGDEIYEKLYAFQLNGVHYHEVLAIKEGKLELLPGGRVFTEEEIKSGKQVAIINKLLADKNNLKVGDSFVLTAYSTSFDEEKGQPKIVYSEDLSFEVIGITEKKEVPSEKKDKNNMGGHQEWEKTELANRITVPIDIVLKINKTNIQKMIENNVIESDQVEKVLQNSEWYQPIFMLKNPEDIEAFKAETQPLLPELYMVKTATDQFSNIAGPVNQTSKMANWILIVAVLASVLIVSLVVLLFLRDRKHELGVYLSLGERKGKVMGQILLEIFVIAIIALSLSVFTGNILAKSVSDSMIQAQLDASQENMGGVRQYFGPEDYFNSNITTEDVVENYQINLSPAYVGVFFLVSLLTILGSTLVPMFYILRLNPKKILM